MEKNETPWAYGAAQQLREDGLPVMLSSEEPLVKLWQKVLPRWGVVEFDHATNGTIGEYKIVEKLRSLQDHELLVAIIKDPHNVGNGVSAMVLRNFHDSITRLSPADLLHLVRIDYSIVAPYLSSQDLLPARQRH